MANRTNRSDPWHGPDSAFEPNEGPANTDDQFAPVDSRGLGLKSFVERAVQQRASMFETSPTNTTLVPGKIYLRQLRDGTYELLVYKGRSCYDAYPGETAEELLEFAKTFVKEPTW